MSRQLILDVINELEVIEVNGGDDAYMLVENSTENREKLNAIGISNEEINAVGDDDSFCVLALAFNGKYADEYQDGKLIVWGPIDDTFRYRVLNGEGTPSDAERLLYLLDPELLSSDRQE